MPCGRTDRLAVEDQFAGVTWDEMQEKPREGGFTAARFPNDAEGFTLEEREGDAVDGAHAGGFAGASDLEVLREVARDQQRLRGSADVAAVCWRCLNGVAHERVASAHSRTSMAERMPSLTRLKQIEVTKIAAPGNAQDSGAM